MPARSAAGYRALQAAVVLTTLYLFKNNINEKGKKQLRDAVQGRQGFDLEV